MAAPTQDDVDRHYSDDHYYCRDRSADRAPRRGFSQRLYPFVACATGLVLALSVAAGVISAVGPAVGLTTSDPAASSRVLGLSAPDLRSDRQTPKANPNGRRNRAAPPTTSQQSDPAGAADPAVEGTEGPGAVEDTQPGRESEATGTTGAVTEGSGGSDESAEASSAGSPVPDTGGELRTAAGTPGTSATSVAGGTAGAWLSGGTEVDGSFASWRGRQVDSATYWADSQDACENQWGLQGQFADWSGPLVVAIGGLWDKSWADAANGGMDAIWTTCLNAMKSGWGSRPAANLIISLFHEANGNWYEWSVPAGDVGNFKAAYARFRQLQQKILPGVRMAFVLNADHIQGGYQPADMLPAPGDYDLLGVDMYSMHAGVNFDQFPALALSVGKPLIVQEWGVKNDEGGGASFIQYMRDKFVQFGGTGPGKLELENYFNLGEYQISSGSSSPQAAQRYLDLW